MARIGYGAEIVEIIKAIPQEDPIRTEDVARQLAKRFAISRDKAKAVTNVKLKRLADQGELKRLQKGLYCHMQQTVFGCVAPDIDHIMIKNLTVQDGVRIGYESGAALLNRMGLSTLIPRKVEVTTNLYNSKLPDGCHIRLKKPAAAITNRNWRYLQLIDAVERLPDAHVDADPFGVLLAAFIKNEALDPLTLIFTARRYYPQKTVLTLTDLLMEAHDGPAS